MHGSSVITSTPTHTSHSALISGCTRKTFILVCAVSFTCSTKQKNKKTKNNNINTIHKSLYRQTETGAEEGSRAFHGTL